MECNNNGKKGVDFNLIYFLTAYHAVYCNDENCKAHKCKAFKDQIRDKLAKINVNPFDIFF
jgi:hypothetical protein